MSIPAVLYDHVPLHNQYPEDDEGNETAGVSYFVSSMVYRTFAPHEETTDSNDGDKLSNPSEQSEFLNARNNRNEMMIRDGTDQNDENETANETEADEYIESDADTPMETIIEDIDSEYVLIPVSSSAIPVTDYNNMPTVSNQVIKKLSNRFRLYGKALKRVTKIFSKPNRDGTTTHGNTNDIIAKYVSMCATGSLALITKPLELCARSLMSPSIYSSYDWVSETVIDDCGSRLILPGSCVDLDSDRIADDGGETSIYSNSRGVLIVPHGDRESRQLSSVQSSASSTQFGSKTIMVSAHDLLAVKHDQRLELGDGVVPSTSFPLDTLEEEGEEEKLCYSRRCYSDSGYNVDRSTIMIMTTQSITKQWTRALWKLAQRKTSVWYSLSQNYIRRSLQNASHFFISSQYILVQYCNKRKKRSCTSLTISSNAESANNEDQYYCTDYYDCRCTDRKSSRSMILNLSQKIPTDRSVDDEQSSDEAHLSEWGFIDIEMTTSTMQNRENQSML